MCPLSKSLENSIFLFQSFTRAFASMKAVFEKRFGRLDFLLADQDTSYESGFQKYLDRLNIRRFHDKSYQKIAQVERYFIQRCVCNSIGRNELFTESALWSSEL